MKFRGSNRYISSMRSWELTRRIQSVDEDLLMHRSAAIKWTNASLLGRFPLLRELYQYQRETIKGVTR